MRDNKTLESANVVLDNFPQQAFEDLKKKLCSPPILAIPDPKK